MKFSILSLGILVALVATPLLGAASVVTDSSDRELHFNFANFKGPKLVIPGNTSICGLPMKTKGFRRRVIAGRKFMVGIKLKNNVAQNFNDVVLKLVLPEGANYKKAKAFPQLASQATVEQRGTEVVWRNIAMRAGKSRTFKVVVDIDCLSPTPLVFRSYTTIDRVGWITGPDVQVVVVSSKHGCTAIPTGPVSMTENVVALTDTSSVPSGTWTTQPGSINSNQAIRSLPSTRRSLLQNILGRMMTASGYNYALRQQTLSNPSKATTGVYYEPHGICNGLLFKNFVKSGFQFSYEFWVDSTPAGYNNIYAPDIRIQTRSPATGEYSDFIWNPYANSQTSYQTWVTASVNQNTGSSGNWPVGTTGGTGWLCTLGCYVPANTTGTQAYPPSQAYQTFRSLDTYVEGLESFGTCTSASCAINDAIITGIEIVLGPNEPDTVAFTRTVSFAAAANDCSYEWTFGPN